jgi:hypothetical protein
MELLQYQEAARRAQMDDRAAIITHLDQLVQGQLQSQMQMEELKQISLSSRDQISYVAGLMQSVCQLDLF